METVVTQDTTTLWASLDLAPAVPAGAVLWQTSHGSSGQQLSGGAFSVLNLRSTLGAQVNTTILTPPGSGEPNSKQAFF